MGAGRDGAGGGGSVMTPCVTILMPVRDESAYLNEALHSIQPTPGISLQVVLIDDASQDDTADIARQVAAERPELHMTVLVNPRPGKAAAVNLGFEHAHGDVIVLLAGDDRLVSALLPQRALAVLPNDQPRVAQCRYWSFSEDPADDGVTFPRPGRETHLAGGATSFNRAFAHLYFPIPEELPNEDTWLRAIAMLHEVSAVFIDAVGLHYRLHENNATGRNLRFAVLSDALTKRHAAYGLALTHFPDTGTSAARARLAKLAQAETHRAAGRWWCLALMQGLQRSDRLVYLLNATPALHALKVRLWPALRRRLR